MVDLDLLRRQLARIPDLTEAEAQALRARVRRLTEGAGSTRPHAPELTVRCLLGVPSGLLAAAMVTDG